MVSEREGDIMKGCVENPLSTITPGEKAVLALMAQGFSNEAIADNLVLSRRTVEGRIRSIFSKIGVSDMDKTFNPRVKVVLLYQENTPSFKNPFDDHEIIVSFTPRQKEIASLVGQGYSNTTIAERLNISLKTVENYINRILNEEMLPLIVDYQIYNRRVILVLVSQTKQLME